MKKKIFAFCVLVLLVSCSSDKVFHREKKDFWGLYWRIAKEKLSTQNKEITNPSLNNKKNLKWLSNYKQPIILISSLNKKNQATLVALGNNRDTLTWVSSDGISLSYHDGLLIATRGFSQDLISLKYPSTNRIFQYNAKKYHKIHRYINGENKYRISSLVVMCQR